MAKISWITAAPGIRYREHPTRRHGLRPDRYFVIRHRVDGRRVEEVLGWASKGMTLTRAQEVLGGLLTAKRTGEGHASLRAGRDARHTRNSRSVRTLWDRYAKEIVAITNKSSTAEGKLWMWEKRIQPAIGELPVADVTSEHIGQIVRSALRLDAKGRVVSGLAPAGQVYRLLHHLFAKALLWGLRPMALGNPCAGVVQPKAARRERLLSQGEVGALLRTLDEVASDGSEAPQIVAVIKAAILTGARIGELLTLRWNDIRRDESSLHLTDTKTGFSRRPISREALALFDGLERVVGSAYVFTAVKAAHKPLNYHTVQKAFVRIADRAGIADCSIHTLRHWFATMTANSVSNARIGMALTGHKSHAAYMNYIHGDKEQARALADQIGAFTADLVKVAGEKVVTLARK